MANLVGKKASTVEALLLDKNDMKQEPIIGAGGVSKDIILITSGATEKAPDEDISFPQVVPKNIITAINDAQTEEKPVVTYFDVNNKEVNGVNTLTINNKTVTIEKCKSSNEAARATMATTATILNGQIDWETINNSGVSTPHTLEPVEIFGDGYTSPGVNRHAPLNGYDCTKGSIEERLSSLGFKKGTITYGGKSYSSETPYADGGHTGGIWRQGNIVWCQVIDSFKFKSGPIAFKILEIDKFLPVADVYFSVNWYFRGNNFFAYHKLSDSGTIEQLDDGTAGNLPPEGTKVQVSFNFGYNAQ